jgi:hypothetical protein
MKSIVIIASLLVTTSAFADSFTNGHIDYPECDLNTQATISNVKPLTRAEVEDQLRVYREQHKAMLSHPHDDIYFGR